MPLRLARVAASLGALLWLAAVAPAQVLVKLGVVAPEGRAALRAALERGMPPAPKRPAVFAVTRFRPGPARLVVSRIAAAYAEHAGESDRQDGLAAAFEATITEYEQDAAKAGMHRDIAGALAVLFAVRSLVTTGKDLPDGVGDRIAFQLQAALDTTAIAELPDTEKQAVFEWALCTASMFTSMHRSLGRDEEGPQPALAGPLQGLLHDALGLDAAESSVGARGFEPTRTPDVEHVPRASKDMVQLRTITAAGAAAVRAALYRGIPTTPEPPRPVAASQFRRTPDRVALDRLVELYGKSDGLREFTREIFEAALTSFERAWGDSPQRDDVASGILLLLSTRDSLITAEKIPQETASRVVAQLRAALETQAMRELPDSEKQAVQEWLLCTMAVLESVQADLDANDKPNRLRLLATADELLQSVFAIPAGCITIGESGIVIESSSAQSRSEQPGSGKKQEPEKLRD